MHYFIRHLRCKVLYQSLQMWLAYLVVTCNAGFFHLSRFLRSALVAISINWMVKRWRSRWTLLIYPGICIFCFSILSAFKVTNEPLLSNNWTFYNSDELMAFDWVDTHMQVVDLGRLQRKAFDNSGAHAKRPFLELEWILLPRLEDDELRTFLVKSNVIRVRSIRLGLPLPVPYDGIQVMIMARVKSIIKRPQTQYQR